jgi:hypothetical protein
MNSLHFTESESSCSVHKSQSLAPILSQANPVNMLTPYLLKVNFNIEILDFCVGTPCNLVGGYRRFGGIYTQLQGRRLLGVITQKAKL